MRSRQTNSIKVVLTYEYENNMLITKNFSTCKSASTKLLNPVDIGSGNIIPNWWYSTILTTAGKADTMAIALLSELWFLYRSTGQEEHQKDYDYFCNKFRAIIKFCV